MARWCPAAAKNTMFVFRRLESGDHFAEGFVPVFIAQRWWTTYEEKPNSESVMTFGIAFYILFVSVLVFQRADY
jgi:hypothetical protein